MWMEKRNLLFLNADVEGKYFAQVLTNALWYITNQHDTINDRARREKEVLGVPPEFDKFKNYNDLKKKRQKLGTHEATQMKTHSEI
uniref:Uncharacterized protein n=1 Tax=Magallana gigas TaxID=29159 RepID=A0A8W8K6P7_MAGGI